MDERIERTIKWFGDIYLKGIPILLEQNETAFLSFLCVVAAIDALAGYRYTTQSVGDRFRRFIKEYFPASYSQHVANLYLFRCRMLHNFSPAYFAVVHDHPKCHLQRSPIGDWILSDETFFRDMRTAAEKYFAEVQSDTQLQSDFLARLQNINEGGAIWVQ